MEKLIARSSFWLGIACLVIAVIWRAVNAFGLLLPVSVPAGHVWYLSFFHGSILFFVTTIAASCYAWLNSQKP